VLCLTKTLQATIFGGAVANMIQNVKKRHPLTDRPLIDYQVSLILEVCRPLFSIIFNNNNVFFFCFCFSHLFNIETANDAGWITGWCDAQHNFPDLANHIPFGHCAESYNV
jgi:hypothetical protein